jgi:hypothetical protein
MTFVGLDLHKRYITACALDAAGGIVGEVRRMPVSLDALGDFLAALPGPVTVGMEATLYWQWLHDQRESRASSEVRRPYKPSLRDVTLGRRQSRAKKPAHQSRGQTPSE